MIPTSARRAGTPGGVSAPAVGLSSRRATWLCLSCTLVGGVIEGCRSDATRQRRMRVKEVFYAEASRAGSDCGSGRPSGALPECEKCGQ
jgi:hypothetical protein